jgi:hypothetical protein
VIAPGNSLQGIGEPRFETGTGVEVNKDTVHRIWRAAGVKPHRLERYMASDDPDFEAKAADIIGLYLNPPQHAAVFCVDEKSAIQALDRLDPVLPSRVESIVPYSSGPRRPEPCYTNESFDPSRRLHPLIVL